MPRDFCAKPSWVENAVATNRGWENPDTGELYVSLRGLLDIQKELGCAPVKAKKKKANAAKTAVKTTKPKKSKAKKAPVAKTTEPKKDDISFEDALVEVIRNLEVNDKNYTEGGKPDANVLSDIMDVRVSANQRDVAWEKFQGEKEADVQLSVETPVVDLDVKVDL